MLICEHEILSLTFVFCRVNRPYLLTKWRKKGGVLLIGYSTFRNLSLGKHVKDRNAANEISYALQVIFQVLCFIVKIFSLFIVSFSVTILGFQILYCIYGIIEYIIVCGCHVK
jgi:hypothetical protein